MNDYRLIVTGSRDWPRLEEYRVFQALEGVHVGVAVPARLVVVHGANPRGVDAMASTWAKAFESAGHNVIEEPHPAKWLKHRRSAGVVRNQEMVDLGADRLIAFIMPCSKRDCLNPEPHGSHGTMDCYIRAARARIPTEGIHY